MAVFGRLLLGLLAARTLDLANLAAHRRLLTTVLVAGGLAGLAGNATYAGELLSGASDPLPAFLRRLLLEGGYLGLTLAYASGMALLFQHAAWTPVLGVFAPVGRMVLTFYLLQTAIGLWLFYGFTGGPAMMGRVGPAPQTVVVLAGFALQVVLARAWLARFQYGPAEWLWRTLTYGAPQPLRVARQPW